MDNEKEFLSHYSLDDYERPSVTADIVAFMVRSEDSGNYKRNSDKKLSVLLVRRGGHPYRGYWALPGGFLEPHETLDHCALREVTEETNVTPVSLMPVGIFSEPGRDPRGWIISSAYACIISEESVNQQGGDDASDAQWFDVDFYRDEDYRDHLILTYQQTQLHAILAHPLTRFGRTSYDMICDNGGLAFDHARIIAVALSALRACAKEFDVIFDFLPETFTLNALQKVQETIMNVSVLPANFRRKVMTLVEETGETTQGAGHRPAKLYRRKKQ